MTFNVGDKVAYMQGLVEWTVEGILPPDPHSAVPYLTLVRPGHQIRHKVRADLVFPILPEGTVFHKGDIVAFRVFGEAPHKVIRTYDSLEVEVLSPRGVVRFVSKNRLHTLRLLRRAA